MVKKIKNKKHVSYMYKGLQPKFLLTNKSLNCNIKLYFSTKLFT